MNFQPLEPLPSGPLSEAQLRAELLRLKASLCQELELIAGVVLNTGILTKAPKRIMEMTGLPIDELEARETKAFIEEPADGNRPITELLEQVRTIEWLNRLHLMAIDDVLMQNPRFRPIEATGSIARFLELHDVIIGEMRRDIVALTAASATLDEARKLGAFWDEVLIPHARAEESALFPLARTLEDKGLTRSADLVESEHQSIDQAVALYRQTLRAVEQGTARFSDLMPLAQRLRGQVELHFGKEEESVVRVLQAKVTDVQFNPIVLEQGRAIGNWARAHGWEG